MPSLGEVFRHLRDWFVAQSISRRLTVVGALAGFLMVFMLFVIRYKEGSKELLYGRLSEEDVSAICAKLKAYNVEYEVRDGNAVYVPRGAKYDLKAQLHTDGLALGGSGVGFEIFDRNQLGVTDYIQKVNYQRALRGEVAKTINAISVVESSRVTIQAPEPSPFLEEEKEPSASVVVKTRAGQRLTSAQISGIANIVATAVAGLTAENVKVINSRGELLSLNETPELVSVTHQQLQHQRAYEQKIKRNIESMLERWVGRGHVAAQVSAEFDFSQVEETEETYEDDNKALTQQRVTAETQNGAIPNPMGVPGAVSNEVQFEGQTAVVGSAATATGGGQRTEMLIYQPGRREVTKRRPIGQLTNLQAAVLVDGEYEIVKEEDGTETRTFKNRFDEPGAREEFEALVKQAMGYNEDRGDKVTVVCQPFDMALIPSDDEDARLYLWEERIRHYLQYFLSIGLPVLIVLAFFFMVLRPFVRYLDRQQASARQAEARLRTVAELEASLGSQLPQDASDLSPEVLRKHETKAVNEQAHELVQRDPSRSAKMIKSWLES
jgi:flagellar M-ring protein FliF